LDKALVLLLALFRTKIARRPFDAARAARGAAALLAADHRLDTRMIDASRIRTQCHDPSSQRVLPVI
jgi:hypothetical protein